MTTTKEIATMSHINAAAHAYGATWVAPEETPLMRQMRETREREQGHALDLSAGGGWEEQAFFDNLRRTEGYAADYKRMARFGPEDESLKPLPQVERETVVLEHGAPRMSWQADDQEVIYADDGSDDSEFVKQHIQFEGGGRERSMRQDWARQDQDDRIRAAQAEML